MPLDLPYCLEADAHLPLQKFPDRLERRLILNTGTLARLCHQGKITQIAVEGLCAQAYEAVARDLLLLPVPIRNELAPTLLDEVCPFGSGNPTFGDLCSDEVGMCLYPLHLEHGANVALVADAGSGPMRTEMSSEGESWTLAARLASTSRQDPELRIDLAESWVVTGVCRQNEDVIRRIELGNKPFLSTPSRIWMLPAEVDDHHRLKRYRRVNHLQDAVAHIRGIGCTEGEDIPWPCEIQELHSFTSRATKPVIQACLQGHVKHLVLWHSNSDDSIRSKDELQALSEDLGYVVEELPISSTSLAEAERTLQDSLEYRLSTGQPLYFNITNGNRLMGLAPLQLARRFPNLHLIYKDVDASFICIRFTGDEPVTQRMHNEGRDERINWAYLECGKPHADLEELKKNLFLPENTSPVRFPVT